MHTGELALLAQTFSVYLDGAFSFYVDHFHRYTEIWWKTQTYVHMIEHRMTFQYLVALVAT